MGPVDFLPPLIILLSTTSRCHPYTTQTVPTMSVSEQLAAIEHALAIAKAENDKLAKGQKAAAPKVRNSLLDIGKTCSDARKAVLDIGKGIPVKKRAPKEVKEDPVPSSGDESPEVVPAAPVELAAAPAAAAKKPRAPRKPKVVAEAKA